MVLISAVSVTWGQLPSLNIKWKFQKETNHVLNCTSFWGSWWHLPSSCSFSIGTWSLPLFLPIGHSVAASPEWLLQNPGLVVKWPLFYVMAPKHKSSNAGSVEMPERRLKRPPFKWKCEHSWLNNERKKYRMLKSTVKTWIFSPWNCEERRKICSGFAVTSWKSHGGGAWWAAVHGVAKSPAWLSNFTFTFHFHALEKEMATHSSVLAWRIPGTEEPGRLPSMGSHRVGHDWSDLAAAAYCKSHIHCMW